MLITFTNYITGGSCGHRHFHDSHQLLLITSGFADIKINGKTARAGRGTLAVFSRFEKHSVKPASEDFCRYVIRVSPAAVQRGILYTFFANRPAGFSNFIDTKDNFSEVSGIFAKILKETEQEMPMQEQMLTSLMDRLLIMIYRMYPNLFSLSDEKTSEKIRLIQYAIEENFAENFSLENLSAEYGISVSYLSHSFKKITGVPVMEYLQRCRLNHAKKLLTHSQLSVGEIVEICGFSDSSNFSRAFKNLSGLSPTEFRKKYS